MASQGLKEDDIELVRASWNSAMIQSSDIATIFYNRLFYLNPHLRPLFKNDIRTQAKEFLTFLSYIIDNLESWSEIRQEVIELGAKHVQYEVKAEHYEMGGRALFYALEKILNHEWDVKTQTAWSRLYTLITLTMINKNL